MFEVEKEILEMFLLVSILDDRILLEENNNYVLFEVDFNGSWVFE